MKRLVLVIFAAALVAISVSAWALPKLDPLFVPVPTPPQIFPPPTVQLLTGVMITAYCPCEKCTGEWSDGWTKTGKDAYRTSGFGVADAPIPSGTKLYTPGIGGVLPADDRCGKCNTDWNKEKLVHLDLRFPLHQEADEFGIKHDTFALIIP